MPNKSPSCRWSIRTLTTVPMLCSVDDDATRTLAIENIVRLPEDMRRLRLYLADGSTWALLCTTTPKPVSPAVSIGTCGNGDARGPASSSGSSGPSCRCTSATFPPSGDSPISRSTAACGPRIRRRRFSSACARSWRRDTRSPSPRPARHRS